MEHSLVLIRHGGGLRNEGAPIRFLFGGNGVPLAGRVGSLASDVLGVEEG